MIKRKIWVAAGLALSLTTGVYASEGEAGEGGPKPADSADKFYRVYQKRHECRHAQRKKYRKRESL